MKSTLALALALLSTLAVASHGGVRSHCHASKNRFASTDFKASTSTSTSINTSPSASISISVSTSTSASPSPSPSSDVRTSTGSSTGWGQKPSGNASFTAYTGCQAPSCGIQMTSGFTAAINVFGFGAWSGAGDVCGRCFKITPNSDPYSLESKGPFGNTIVVRATDLCPFSSGGGPPWCDQTASHPLNQDGMSMHFDLCEDSGAAKSFFYNNRGALTGRYEEVSCTEWQGTEGKSLWGGSCVADIGAPLWPSTSCGNKGTPPQ